MQRPPADGIRQAVPVDLEERTDGLEPASDPLPEVSVVDHRPDRKTERIVDREKRMLTWQCVCAEREADRRTRLGSPFRHGPIPNIAATIGRQTMRRKIGERSSTARWRDDPEGRA